MSNENQILIEALRYYEMGFSLIPVGRDKKPLVKWEPYQHTRAAKEQIETWFKNSGVNIGIVTGAISKIVVIDVDTTEKIDRPIPPTVTSQTGRGGRHYFCNHPNKEVKTRAGILPNVDIRGDGGYVVAPPSIHQNGNSYTWVVPPEESDFAELPEWVLNAEKPTNNTPATIEDSIPEGMRNDRATQIAGKLLSSLNQNLWEFAWGALKEWNRDKCKPPLNESELRIIFESISSREAKKRNHNVGIQALPLSELVAMDFPTPQWLVERLIPHEAVTIISGAPASYKTFLTLEIALKIASGEKVFGEFQTAQTPVLIIDEENHPRVLQERAKLLSQNPELPIFVASKNGFVLGEKSVQEVVEYAKSINARLVIFDSFICIHDADENVASEMRNVMKSLKEIASQGIAVIVIHHHRKKGKDKGNASQDIRGSSDIVAQVDCHLAVDRKGRDASVTIQQSKLREAQEIEPFTVKFQSDGQSGKFEYAGKIKEGQNKRSEIKTLIKKVLEAADKIPNRAELWTLVQQSGAKGGEATFKTAIKEMLESKELFSKKGRGNSTLYSLNEFSIDDG